MRHEDSKTRSGDDCPTGDQLYAVLKGILDEESTNRIAGHITVCRECERKIDAIALDDLVLPVPQRGKPFETYRQEPECMKLVAEADLAAVAPNAGQTHSFQDTDAAGEIKESLPQEIDGFRLTARIAHGGMGVVYRAHQPSLNRDVALKMLHPGLVHQRLLDRFRVESNAVARLQHPHVVQIFDSGSYHGRPYFTMELMEGGDLQQRLETGPMRQQAACQLVQLLANAIQHAHQKGVLHRDLKPSNVLFTADGLPKVSDFGLARIFDTPAQHERLTHDDAVLGTPSYMAPEQSLAAWEQIGPATDVYGLGAVMYSTLTGKPPFQSKSKLETLELVRRQAPEPPSRSNSEVSPGLEAICLKCLAKSPASRYESAGDLSRDLGRWLAGEATEADRERTRRGRRRWLQAAVATGLVAGIGWSITAAVRRRDHRSFAPLHIQLYKGASVTLVGDTGMPVRYQLVGQTNDAELIPSKDGRCSLRTGGATIVLLLDDPQHDHYRLQAEVRTDQTGPRDCGVGLIVGHREWSTPDAELHTGCILRFNDLEDERLTHATIFEKAPPEAEIPPIPPGNSLLLDAYSLFISRQGEILEPKLLGTTDQYFSPRVGVWRKIEFEVSPKLILVRWDESQVPMRIDTADAETAIRQNVLDRVGGQFKVAPPCFPVRGGLGLYVRNATGSFRNVSIKID